MIYDIKKNYIINFYKTKSGYFIFNNNKKI